MYSPPRSRSPFSLGRSTLVLAFTLASAFGVNPYRYGSGDNSITIPFLKASLDPSLYPGDYLIAQRPYYYTVLWNVLGWIHARLGPSLPALFFAVYLGALFFTFLALYEVGVDLFGRAEIGVLALTFALFSKLTLGDVNTIEAVLNTRGVAIPVVLWALHDDLNGRTVRAFALAGVAYLIHPLTTHYVLAMLLVAELVHGRSRGLGRLAAGLAVFLVVASPVLIWKTRHTPPSLRLLSADPRWVEALRIRSGFHMFPSTWSWDTIGHGVLVVALFVIGWTQRNREADARHRVVGVWALVVAALVLAGALFSEVWPIGLDFVVQPLRAFVFLEYFAALYVAHFVFRGIESATRVAGTVFPAAAALAMAEGVDRIAIPLTVFLVAAVAISWLRLLRPDRVLRRFAAAMAGLAVLAAGAAYATDRLQKDQTFSIRNDQEYSWLDVERWARAHTDRRDVFVVPPEAADEFRVEGERGVYADWEDGGLMNGDPAFGIEWMRRMKRLGFDVEHRDVLDFCGLEPDRLGGIADEMRGEGTRVFMVSPCGENTPAFPMRYSNGVYSVVEITPAPAPAPPASARGPGATSRPRPAAAPAAGGS